MSGVDAVVAGAGGFIGGHLARDLVARGLRVRAVDVKPLDAWQQHVPGTEEIVADLSELEACRSAVRGAREVFNLAADMGGMGFIESNKALCMLSVLINTHLLVAARGAGIERYFFASSACVYKADRQDSPDVVALTEADAYPAMPEDGYGWEKLFGERMCRHFREDFGLATTVVRYHNVYGPHGTWTGGREKAPAAICRKVSEAVLTGSGVIDIWGDGKQTRSFTYITDCLEGTRLVSAGDDPAPVNVGSSELVSVNDLVGIVEEIAGVRLERRHDLTAPQGVRGRNSDNTLVQQRYNWQPSVSLREGLEETYAWVHEQVASRLASTSRVRVSPSSGSPTGGSRPERPHGSGQYATGGGRAIRRLVSR